MKNKIMTCQGKFILHRSTHEAETEIMEFKEVFHWVLHQFFLYINGPYGLKGFSEFIVVHLSFWTFTAYP